MIEKHSLIVPNVEVYELYRVNLDLLYEVRIYVPKIEKPRKGWPLYILLDGNATFLTGVEMMRLQTINLSKTKIIPGVIVGIGEKNENPFPPTRSYDMTTKAKPETMERWFKNRKMPTFKNGGADEFFLFINDEVLPFVYEAVHVNRENKTLMGHSLAGLFTLYSYTKNPSLFEKYIVASPSLWWNDEEILGQLPQRKTKVEIKIVIGGDEPRDMKLKCQKAVDLLNPYVRSVRYIEYEQENHMSSLNKAILESFKK